MKIWRVLFCSMVLTGSGEVAFSQLSTPDAGNQPSSLVQRDRGDHSTPSASPQVDWVDTIPLPDLTPHSGSALPSETPSSVTRQPSAERAASSDGHSPPPAAFDEPQAPLSPIASDQNLQHHGPSRFTFLGPVSGTPTGQAFLARLTWRSSLPSFAHAESAHLHHFAHALPLWRYGSLFHPNWEPPPLSPHAYGHIDIILNKHVARNVTYFQDIIPERFQTYLNRFEPYKDLVRQIFREFGLPVELAYLSLVESGFNPRAYSRARAAGPWQFMKGTGRLYGLRINWYVDERRDPVKSTVAAAHHLRDLYDQFRSWPLALAAYNAGSGKITRAVSRLGSRDFWKIRRTRYIRRETKEYVPRFMAATLIAENPQDYGFSVPSTDPHQFEEVVLHKRVHIKTIAKHTGIPFTELQRLNPELRRHIVPSRPDGYHLKVPVGTRALVESRLDAFEPWTQPPPPATMWYRVRRGDSLSVVAKRFGMTIRTLKKLNNLSHNLIRVGQRLRVRAEAPPIDPKSFWYTVRYGDSLSTIAQRFGTTVAKLKRLNRLQGHLIHPGTRLRVRAPSQTGTSEVKWYRVRPGDSLWSIAKRFSVSVMDLKILNNLTSSVIRAGRLLMVSQ